MKNEEKENLVIKLGILFYFCNIVGFYWELALNYFYTGKLLNHGALYGPWLPIYGIGALLLMSIYKLRKKPVLIFVLSFFITGTLEYICGFLLLKFLKIRLWDYTGRLLNIGGHVCLISAFCFGVGGLIITYVVYPLIKKLVNKFDKKHLKIVLSIITIIFLTDVIATIKK